MRAYVFVRYHSGDGAGHVGWGFELPDGRVCCGSVENHSGHLFTPASQMGFWCVCTAAFTEEFLKRGYDDLCWYEIPNGDWQSALRVTQWIEHLAYRAAFRNCEDDVYDVLRTYGVQPLETPFINWFPRWWFKRLRGAKLAINGYDATPRRAAPASSGADEAAGLEPMRPDWRKPWHWSFPALKAAKMLRFRF